jgi:hypothetical protein
MSTSWTNHLAFNNPPGLGSGGAIAGGDQDWSQFFGQPRTQEPIPAYQIKNVGTWVLPRAYWGRSEFLGNTFKLLAIAGNSFLTTTILPLQFTNEMNQHWGRWEFPAYLAEVVPELGVVRFVKSNYIEQNASLVRYGMGMQMQHGFMHTELGRIHYVMHMRQINQAILEGLQFEALFALANVENWAYDTVTKSDIWNASNAQHTLMTVMERDVDAWGITQLKERADVALDNFIENANKTYNTKLNTYIIDSRIPCFLNTMAYDMINAYKYGEADLNNKLMDGMQANYIFKGNRVYVTRKQLVEQTPVNPLERHAQIGEFFRCFDWNKSDYTGYKSAKHRAQQYYNEDEDNLSTLFLSDKIIHSHRFDPETGRLRSFNTAKHYASASAHFGPSDFEMDHLHRKTSSGEIRELTYFGQMKPAHFNQRDMKGLCTTVFAAIAEKTNKTSAHYENAFANIADKMTIMHNIPYGDAYRQLLDELRDLQTNRDVAPNLSDSSFDTTMNIIRPNIYNTLDLPLGQAFADNYAFKRMKLPPTHGTYGGFKYIQSLWQSKLWTPEQVPFNVNFGKQINKALPLFDEFVEYLVQFFPDSVFLSTRFSPATATNPSPHETFFANFFGIDFPSRPWMFNNEGYGSSSSSSSSSSTFSPAELEGLTGSTQNGGTAQTTLDTNTGPIVVEEESLSQIRARYSSSSVYDDTESTQGDSVWKYNADFDSWSPAAQQLYRDSGNDDETPRAGDPVIIPDYLNDNEYFEIQKWRTFPFPASVKDKQMAVITILAAVKNPSRATYKKALSEIRKKLAFDIRSVSSPDQAEDGLKRVSVQSLKNLAESLHREGLLPGRESSVVQEIVENVVQETQEVLSAAIGAKQNRFGESFIATPITIGRNALREYVRNVALSGNLSERVRPASYQGVNDALDSTEINSAIQFINNSNIYDLNSVDRIGAIYDNNPRSGHFADIDNLYFVQKAREYEKTASFKNVSDEIMGDRARSSQRYVTDMNRATEEATLFGTTYAPSAKRSRQDQFNDFFNSVENNSQNSGSASSNFVSPLTNIYTDLFVQEEIEDPSLRQNYAIAVRNFKKAERAIILTYLFTPISLRACNSFDQHNILFPWDFICARPHANYLTLTTVKCLPGSETGNMYIGNIEAMAGDDAATHVHTVNVVYYAGAIIHTPENVFRVDNSFICGYMGGLGSGFQNPDTYNPRRRNYSKNDPSFMIFTIPRHEVLNPDVISICGKPKWYSRTGNEIDLKGVTNIFGYSTSAYYSAVWGFHQQLFNAISDEQSRKREEAEAKQGNTQLSSPNAYCYASFALYEGGFASSQKGHWKAHTVGPSAHRARMGKESFNNTPTPYSSIYKPLPTM